jgi:hypothetical protein
MMSENMNVIIKEKQMQSHRPIKTIKTTNQEEQEKVVSSQNEEEVNEKGEGLFLAQEQSPEVLSEAISHDDQPQALVECDDDHVKDEYEEIDPAEAEKNAVQAFLKQSQNYKVLTNIQQTSEDNKKSKFGNFFITQVFYEINPEEKKVIADLKDATSFSDLLDKTSMRNKISNMMIKDGLTCMSYGSQRANAGLYLLRLAEEINKHAHENKYSLGPSPRDIPSPSPSRK